MNPLEKLNHWYRQHRMHSIEREIEYLRLEIEAAYLEVNKLIRQKAALEIEQSRREIA